MQQPKKISVISKSSSNSFQIPIIVGILVTVGWYLLIPYIPFRQDLLLRYFCGHPLAYAQTGMFFVGSFILMFRAASFGRERGALDQVNRKIDSIEKQGSMDSERVFEWTSKEYGKTHIAKRLSDFANDSGKRKQQMQELMKYLAEIAADRVHASYSFVRTISWAIPILGFLGTVIGITIAIGNLNFQDYETSMKNVVGGLAIAFDTTALALTLSVVLVFGLFRVERSEQQILDAVEDFCRIRVLPWVTTEESPLLAMEEIPANLSQELFRQTENMIHRQAELWEQSLDAMRNRWNETLLERETIFSDGLENGFSQTLSQHSNHLTELREEMQQRLEESQNVIAVSQQEFTRSLGTVGEQICASLSELKIHEQQQQERFLETFSGEIQEWNSRLSDVSTEMVRQSNGLREICENFASLSGHESQLLHLEQQLHENLDAIRQSQTFEQTLQTLSAAVNLLTTRVGRNAA